MKWCRKCNAWKTLDDFRGVTRDQIIKQVCNAHGRSVRYVPRPYVRKAMPDGLRDKFEQVAARVATGDSIRFACEQVGVDPIAFENWGDRKREAERELSSGVLPAALKESAG